MHKTTIQVVVYKQSKMKSSTLPPFLQNYKLGTF